MRKIYLVPALILSMVMLFSNLIFAQTNNALKFNAGVQCWETSVAFTPDLDPYGYFKFRISQLGQGSFTVNGRQIYYQDVLSWPDAPVTGNAELIDGKWEMNLTAASFNGTSICRASIDEELLNGTFKCYELGYPRPGDEPQHLEQSTGRPNYFHREVLYDMRTISCP